MAHGALDPRCESCPRAAARAATWFCARDEVRATPRRANRRRDDGATGDGATGDGATARRARGDGDAMDAVEDAIAPRRGDGVDDGAARRRMNARWFRITDAAD